MMPVLSGDPRILDIGCGPGTPTIQERQIRDGRGYTESAWIDSYYTLLDSRSAVRRKKYTCDPEALAVVDAEEQGIELYHKYSDYYGYVFCVMQACVVK